MNLAKLKAFAVFDTKLNTFNAPMFLQHVGQAERMFEEIANDPQSIVCKHPADFQLFIVGDFDDVSGVLTAQTPPVQITNAHSVKRKPHPDLPLDLGRQALANV